LEYFEHTIRFPRSSSSPSGGNISSSSTYNNVVAKLDEAYRLTRLPLKLSSICRNIHLVLTSPLARKQRYFGEGMLLQVWEELDRCWEEFDVFREGVNGRIFNGSMKGKKDSLSEEECEIYVAGWQVRFYTYFCVL
jgi:hypothetical protein